MKTRNARVVIGANYGDEGKGLATDAYSAQDDGHETLVIRFNGGAQAGHTVTTPEGLRHVFSHFGSGSFTGAATYLSSFFALNPVEYVNERAELAALGVAPQVFADPDAPVTTPYDVLINQWAEESRGQARHGSVGVGFGETVERTLRGFPLLARDIGGDKFLISYLDDIRTDWLPARAAALGIDYTAERRAAAADPSVISSYLECIRAMRAGIAVAGIDRVLGRRNIVFEGAQGLLLDQDRGHVFPYLTRSNTGLKNALAVAEDAGIERLDVTYMTRSYLTRHGAGPLRHETAKLDFADVVDATNEPNPWQGTLRFAPLDLDVLREAIAADLSDAAGGPVRVNAEIGVSCIDQLHRMGKVFCGGEEVMVPASDFSWKISKETGLLLALESYGPSRDRVSMPVCKRVAA